MSYPLALALASLFILTLERIAPARDQKLWRPGFGWDVVYLLFNGHVLGVGLALVAAYSVDPLLRITGLENTLQLHITSDWPFWLQLGVALVLLDLVQFGIHVMLHKVPFLWQFHQVHHSVVDGQMDWIVSFRFHWAEVVVYKTLQYVPLALLGFSGEVLFANAVLGTLAGHFNHANLRIDPGPLRYVFNSPKMHLWHHDLGEHPPCNFGIVFSVWDWLFGTAWLPESPPRHLGFGEVNTMPPDFFRRSVWPWIRRFGATAPP